MNFNVKAQASYGTAGLTLNAYAPGLRARLGHVGAVVLQRLLPGAPAPRRNVDYLFLVPSVSAGGHSGLCSGRSWFQPGTRPHGERLRYRLGNKRTEYMANIHRCCHRSGGVFMAGVVADAF